MAKKEKRFQEIYTEGKVNGARILLDRKTGVHYLYVNNGYGGGLTVLLDEEGKPVIDKSEANV